MFEMYIASNCRESLGMACHCWRGIVNLNHQLLIYTLNKIEQE
jgi:hypothetical protein